VSTPSATHGGGYQVMWIGTDDGRVVGMTFEAETNVRSGRHRPSKQCGIRRKQAPPKVNLQDPDEELLLIYDFPC